MKLQITRTAHIDEKELVYTFQRSSGPGGQNVNKVSTRVTLAFDLDGSPSLSAMQKTRIHSRLASRVSRSGVLRIVSGRYRTQTANRRATRDRLVELLAEALRPIKPRRKTKVSAGAKARRRDEKRKRGALKSQRRAKPEE